MKLHIFSPRLNDLMKLILSALLLLFFTNVPAFADSKNLLFDLFEKISKDEGQQLQVSEKYIPNIDGDEVEWDDIFDYEPQNQNNPERLIGDQNILNDENDQKSVDHDKNISTSNIITSSIYTKSKQPLLSNKTLIAIQNAIIKYEYIVANGGWDTIPKGRSLREGTRSNRVVALRNRLLITGDLNQPHGNPKSFDRYVRNAVIKYQKRNGILPNGAVTKETLEALNTPAELRLAQLKLNLKRIEQLILSNKYKRYLIVNIPGADLEAVYNNAVDTRHRTIVGKIDRQTPLLFSRISHVSIYPYWHVPDSIVVKDLVPTIVDDIDYLRRSNLRVLDGGWGGQEVDPRSINWQDPNIEKKYKFKQDPGQINSMGWVQIRFPNNHAVYIHDTPTKSLFSRDNRYYSSGCVRVENIRGLVEWVIATEKEWTPAKLDSHIRTITSAKAKIKKNVGVHFAYITAYAYMNGEVNFRNDIYKRDDIYGITKKISL